MVVLQVASTSATLAAAAADVGEKAKVSLDEYLWIDNLPHTTKYISPENISHELPDRSLDIFMFANQVSSAPQILGSARYFWKNQRSAKSSTFSVRPSAV